MHTSLLKKTSWADYGDYILRRGEAGYDMKKREFKIGNGRDPWDELGQAISPGLGSIYKGDQKIEEAFMELGQENIVLIQYQGKEVSLQPGQQATLLTDYLQMQDDVKVIVNKKADIKQDIPKWLGQCQIEEIE